MSIEQSLDFSRALRACDFLKKTEEDKNMHEDVLHFLRQRPAEAMIEFKTKIEAAAATLRNVPLRNYKKPYELEAAWKLTHMPPPFADGEFLSHTGPEGSGVLCGKSGEQPILLTGNDLEHLVDMKYGGKTEIFGLWLSLSRWREAICCVWAGIILRDMILVKRKKTGLLLTSGKLTGFLTPAEQKNEDPMGTILALFDISDKEADDFRELCEKANFGSADCEYAAAEGLKEWLRSANIATIQNCGLNLEEAHHMLLAATQRSPQIDIELKWDQRFGSYRFTCVVENRDTHGFTDPKNTARVPATIVLKFFEETSANIRENMLRLVLRAGYSKARDLLFHGLERALD